MATLDAGAIQDIASGMPDIVGSQAKAYKLSDLMTTEQMNRMKLEDEKEQSQERKQTKNLLRNFDVTSKEGQMKAVQAIQQQVGPEAAMNVHSAFNAAEMQDVNLESKKIENRAREIEFADQKNSQVASALNALDQQYTQLITPKEKGGGGMTPEAASAAMQKPYIDTLGSLANQRDYKGDPFFGPQELQKIPPAYDHNKILGLIQQTAQGRKMLEEYAKQSREERKVEATEKRADIAERAEQEREKADRARETTQRARGSLTPEQRQGVDDMAAMIADYKLAPPSSMALRSPYGVAIMSRVRELNPDYDANQFTVKKSGLNAFATGKQGNAVRSFNVALDHLDTLDQLSTALGNRDTRVINEVGNRWAAATGQAAPVSFDAVKGLVADEIVKAVTGSAGALGDRESAKATLNAANSPEQLRAVSENYKRLMKGQLDGLQRQFIDAGGTLEEWNKKLSPAAQTVGETTASKQTAGGPPAPPVSAFQGHAEGDVITFANGQKWKLQNGQPVKVQ